MNNNHLTNSEPFFFKKGDIGAVLVHGFTGTPYDLRGLGEYLANRNISVSAPLLPGHGTKPNDLINIKWTDWDRTVYETAQDLSGFCKEVFAIGLSMGATLCLHLSLNMKVSGVVAMCSPVFSVYDWKVMFVPILKLFKKFSKKKITYDTNNVRSVGYNVNPIAGVNELLKLMKHTKKHIKDIKTPVFLIHSRKDAVIPFENSEKIYKLLSSDKEFLILEKSSHLVTLDIEKEKVFEEIYKFICKQQKK